MDSTFFFDTQWQMKSDFLQGKSIPAELPGDNYHALLQAGLIPEPYFGKNEKNVQEARKFGYEFYKTFNVPENVLNSDYIYLEAAMVDTFCTCFINGREVFKSCNQFAVQRAEVKSYLKAGDNLIQFKIDAVEPGIAERKKIAPDYDMIRHTVLQGTNLLRKSMCHGGWDWGISLAICGIYDQIKLIGVNKSRVDALYNKQKHEDNKVYFTAVAEVFAPADAEDEFTFEIDNQTKTVKAALKKGKNKVSCDFVIENPRLWFPNNYGKPELYDLSVSTGKQKITKLAGLRTIELVHEADEIGKSMFFKVNGMRIFGKGADFIPCDAMASGQTEEVYRNLIESAARANMNMIRVWGGGQYEKECFYDLCDRNGILVWQDLMFCCAIYPADDWFVDEVAEELEYQIPRLRSHACIALFCGDNECLGATKWFGKDRDEMNMQRFIKLNKRLTELMAQYDVEQKFWPSSPCGGPGSFVDGWKNDTTGDMHYWEVWLRGKNFNSYYEIKPRFCSEFGFEAFPSYELIKSFCPEDELNLFSRTMSMRQKCPLGNAPIISMFEKLFKLPNSIEGIAYQSQVQQALAIKTGVEFWHANQPRCMGTVFWQLNDNWPTVSWSSIEFGGKWKQLQYHAKRFFAPVSGVLFRENGEDAKLYAVNDRPFSVEIKQIVNVRSLVDGAVLNSETFTFSLDKFTSKEVKNYGYAFENGCDPENVFYEIITENLTENTIHKNEYFDTAFKDLKLQKAAVIAEVKESDGKFYVEISTDKPALFVNLDTPSIKGNFSDNSFAVVPGENVVVEFTPESECDAETLQKIITIDHLAKYY